MVGEPLGGTFLSQRHIKIKPQYNIFTHVMCFERNVSEVEFPQQPTQNFNGNQLVEACVCGNGH
jgi:hypothetical protein